jgi:alkylation response protein AidB-like acyl-CoA dehydrogenase
MDFDLTETQTAVVATARAIAREVVAPAAREGDRSGRFPDGIIRKLGEAGLLAINVPEELGGAGAGPVAYVLAMMEIAAADCAVAVTMAVTNMVGEIIARYGTPTQRERCCPKLASAEWLAPSRSPSRRPAPTRPPCPPAPIAVASAGS